MIVWPDTLPRPMRDGFQITRADTRRKRQAEVLPMYMPRFSRGAKFVSMVLDVNQFQRAVFTDFYEIETRNGALVFDMPDWTRHGWPVTNQYGQVITDEDGAPVLISAIWRCQFGENLPAEAVVGTRFRISFNVMVLP